VLLTLHQSVFSRCDAVGPLAPVDVGRVVALVGEVGHEELVHNYTEVKAVTIAL